ncbi:MAG: hypothetical protein R3C39_02135 [Dehalococcoidia bacterium]
MLLVFALVAAGAIGLARPSRGQRDSVDEEARLLERRRVLLDELRELDEDLAAGRIDAADRQAGRRALGPELRAVTEALRDAGIDLDARADVSADAS